MNNDSVWVCEYVPYICFMYASVWSYMYVFDFISFSPAKHLLIIFF